MEIIAMSTCAAILLTASMVVGQTETETSNAVPQQVLNQFDSMVGDWIITGAAKGGGTVEATMEVKWAPGKHMLFWNCVWKSPEIEALGSGIFGWEPLEKQVHMSEFWTAGGFHHRHFKVKSDKLWVGEEFSGTSIDMKPVRQKISFDFIGPDKMVLKTWDYEVDGKKVDGEFEITFTRK
jgi:hypothetical protein